MAVSKANGYFERHWRLALAITDVFSEDYGRMLPLNAAGANGAVLADMAIDPYAWSRLGADRSRSRACRSRLRGTQRIQGQQIWDLVLRQDERNVVPAKAR